MAVDAPKLAQAMSALTRWNARYSAVVRRSHSRAQDGLLLIAIAWFAALAMPARAQDATWLLNPGTSDYNTAANWSPATVPTGTAFFGSTNVPNLTFSSAATGVGGWTFIAGAPAYTVTLGANALLFNGAGIVINDGSVTINNLISLSFIGPSSAGGAVINNASSGVIGFNGTSSAGSSVINNTGRISLGEQGGLGSATIANTGFISFQNQSRGDNATINNGSFGAVSFFDTSTAGNATITNNNITSSVEFLNSSSAGSAVLTNTLGRLSFADASTAGNATVITNFGGTTLFTGSSTGGNAAFTTRAGGVFDMSGLTSTGLTAGSIEGAGNYFLGSKTLTVLGSNLFAEVTGAIQDGGASGGTGGSLVKQGNGILLLSGANTYTGTTTVNGGALIVNGSIAASSDVNGDGFDDLILGAKGADPNGSSSGASYVVFGQAAGFAANLNLSSLDGTNGFQISGEAAEDGSGTSVASAGDINGDGFDDLIIGAYGADPNGSRSGTTYVVFGQEGGFAANLNLSSLDGTNGFQISGEAAEDLSGISVASAGDVNGDGFDDLIIGAHLADPNGLSSGASYVVFGHDGGFAANLNLSSLDGSNGFQISGEAAGHLSGVSVASAGDVNGDGFDDLIIGAPGADPNGSLSGASYVMFGGPGLSAVSASGTEDAASILITLIGSDLDADDAVDSFKLAGLPAHGTLYLDAGLTQLVAAATAYAAIANQLPLYFVPDANWNGQTSFQYTANDGQLDSAAATATINVTAVNDAPTLANAIADQTATPGQAFSFILPADTFADVDQGDALTLATSALPSWLAFDAATATFSGIPGSGDVGVTNVIVTATDLAGAAVSDTFSLTISSAGSDTITGTTDDDVINAQGGNDTINAGDGNDIIVATINDGDDFYDGGEGIDTLDMSAMTASVTIKLNGSVSVSSQTGVDHLNSIENATGGSGDDRITGDGADNVLDGRAGNDQINAGAGNDIVIGGEGDDQLNGGTDNDTFVFASGFGNDSIQHFDANPAGGQDLLDISRIGITAATFANDVIITDLGNDTQVQIGTDSILLVGVNGIGANTITQQDFLLA
jgi:autotransporter-associated beta strand protein